MEQKRTDDPSVVNWLTRFMHKDGVGACICEGQEISAAVAEIERLKGCLKTANAQTENYERRWYLTQDKLAAAQAVIEQMREIFTEIEKIERVRMYETCPDCDFADCSRENGCRYVENPAPSARKAIALPTDDTALRDRLRQERERCAKECDSLANCEENTDGYRGGATWCAERIRSIGDE